MTSDIEIFREAIRNPTPENANLVYGSITPDMTEDILTSVNKDLANGVDSEIVAEKALDGVFDTVEDEVFGTGADFIFDYFGESITDLVLNGMGSIMEKAITLLVGG